ncbi:MAG: winged helix-turn-helix domain-containing protein [Pseudomonadales bacterium]|nr:winged helix-turn-helix domain-containing protein [Pseudomonadales bacterium]MCP5185148.1 winged helix-turn-helix domain-containing protein [Pseudomonadales bacterium]
MPIYRFGDFELDPDIRQLRCSGQVVPLERRPFDLLALLLSDPTRTFTRQEIVASLWPDNVIIDFEAGLNTLVRKVRQALGDTVDEPRYVATVPARGYRFIAPVDSLTPADTPPRADPPTPVPPVPPESAPASRPRTRLAMVTMLLLLIAGGAVWGLWPREAATVHIAVLPFRNLTGDTELDFLAAGLAEETSLSLARIDLASLRLLGGVSGRAMTAPNVSTQEAGRRLGADYVVDSSLRADATRLRVLSRLVRVADGEALWSAAFDRARTDLLGLQRELSIAIAEQVRQRLVPGADAPTASALTANPTAYALYLQGRYAWSKLSPLNVRQAQERFEAAIEADPGFALAWAGLSQVASTSVMIADAAPDIAVAQAREALRRAVDLSPDLAEVHYATGYLHLFIDWDMPAAVAAARRAIARDPNSATAHMLLGMALAMTGDAVEARMALRRARELDPFFALTWANSANLALMAGDPAEALEYARQAVTIDPDNWVAFFHLGNSLRALGKPAEAIDAYVSAARLSGDNSKVVSALGALLASLGRTNEAREILGQMTERARTGYLPPIAFAVIHVALGETGPALDAIERAIAVHDVHLLGLRNDPRLRALQAEPRFQTLVQRAEAAGANASATPDRSGSSGI